MENDHTKTTKLLRLRTTCAIAAAASLVLGACGDDDSAEADRSATLAPLADSGLSGSLSLSETDAGVRIRIKLEGCTDGAEYPVHIHEGTGCADNESQGGHWGTDGIRGEGITNVVCKGNVADTTYTNPHTNADQIWTLDGNQASDPTGHAFVVHANDEAKTRIACGVIE